MPVQYPPQPSNTNDLRRALRGWQIFFIVASVIIGEGVFAGDSQALEVAGPYGTILGLILMGILAVCVMEGVSEFVQLFAVPNAVFEYITVFVDEDLAWACGIAYWYTWASVFAALNLTAANFSTYWNFKPLWGNIVFFFIVPFALFGINMVGVWFYGLLETIGGFLKLCLVFGTGVIMYHLYVTRPFPDNDTPIYDGFEADPGIVPSRAAAVCYVIPILAYSFIGVETVAVTAFEAEDLHSLRRPSQTIAYVIMALYFFTLISELLLTSWLSPILPAIYGNNNSTQKPPPKMQGDYNLPVVAAQNAGYQTLASFLNGCYIYSVLSASNSALYVASRTLYGLTRGIKSERGLAGIFGRFNKTNPRTGVPGWAVLMSMLSFIWYPFVSNVSESDAVTLLFDVMAVTASVMCLIVWAALSLAFIRFRRWVRLCRGNLDPEFKRYDRDDPNGQYGATTLFFFAQPLPAFVGLVGSLSVVLVLTTATWWNRDFNAAKFALSYAGPIVVLVLWFGRKAYLWRSRKAPGASENHWHGWVKISDDASVLMQVFDRFEYFRPPEYNPESRNRLRQKFPWLVKLYKKSAGLDQEANGRVGRANGVVSNDRSPMAGEEEHPSGLVLRDLGAQRNNSRDTYGRSTLSTIPTAYDTTAQGE